MFGVCIVGALLTDVGVGTCEELACELCVVRAGRALGTVLLEDFFFQCAGGCRSVSVEASLADFTILAIEVLGNIQEPLAQSQGQIALTEVADFLSEQTGVAAANSQVENDNLVALVYARS